MNKREKAFYDSLPAELTHEQKLDFMSKWGCKFVMLPERTKARLLKQAYADRKSQYVIKHKGKLIAVPQHDTFTALKRLGIDVQAEITLLQ